MAPSISLPVVRPQPAFNGLPFTIIEFHGRPTFIASEVGRILGYGDNGLALPRQIRTEWADRLDEDVDYIILKGKALGDVLLQVGKTHAQNASKIRHLLLLSEEGLYAVLGATDKPIGKAFRRHLSQSVLPALRQGRPVAREIAPSPDTAQLTRRLDEQERLLDRLTLALSMAGIRLPPVAKVKALPVRPAAAVDPHATFARFMAWCHGAGLETFYVAGAERAPKNCLGVVDGEHVYFVGAAPAVALDLKPGTDTSEIARAWLTEGLLDAHPHWDRHLINSAKWSKYAPWFGTRKMFRARLDAPSCAG